VCRKITRGFRGVNWKRKFDLHSAVKELRLWRTVWERLYHSMGNYLWTGSRIAPEGTAFENTDPRRLIYVKRRLENEGDSQDRTITTVFAENDKLAMVESQVGAIRSRP